MAASQQNFTRTALCTVLGVLLTLTLMFSVTLGGPLTSPPSQREELIRPNLQDWEEEGPTSLTQDYQAPTSLIFSQVYSPVALQTHLKKQTFLDIKNG